MTPLEVTAHAVQPRPERKFGVGILAMTRPRKATYLLIAMVVGAVIASLCLGAVEMSPMQILAVLAGKLGIATGTAFSDQQSSVLLAIRFPRVLLGIVVGAGLAVAGTVLQSLFRNPLADPGLIGVSTGSAFAVSVGVVLGERFAIGQLSFKTPYFLPFVAFLGGLTATYIVYRIGKSKVGSNVATMLLAGIAVNAFAVAGIGLMSFLATDAQLRNILFWNLGSLAGATWKSLLITVPLISIAIIGLLRLARPLNVILLGESDAAHLGVDVEKIKWKVIFFVALAVGAAVAVTGAIGFVGLIVPHLLRMTTGVDHRHLLINSALLGAAMLVGGDVVSRGVLSPAEIPIGIVTAIVGVPFFIWLLIKKNV